MTVVRTIVALLHSPKYAPSSRRAPWLWWSTVVSLQNTSWLSLKFYQDIKGNKNESSISCGHVGFFRILKIKHLHAFEAIFFQSSIFDVSVLHTRSAGLALSCLNSVKQKGGATCVKQNKPSSLLLVLVFPTSKIDGKSADVSNEEESDIYAAKSLQNKYHFTPLLSALRCRQ